MRLAYVTTILTPHDDGQSLQVQAMAHVFHEQLKDDFLLVSPAYHGNKRLSSPVPWQRIRVWFTSPRALRYLLFLLGSLQTVSRFHPDWVYSRDIGVAIVYRLLGYRVVYEVHKPFDTRMGSVMFRLFHHHIVCVTISDALADFIRYAYSHDPTKLTVARDGVFLDAFVSIDREVARRQLKDEMHISPTTPVVLYSGNLYPGKGLEIILAAAKQLSDVAFVVVGINTVAKGSSEDRPPNLYFLGRKDSQQIPGYLCGADIVLLPFTTSLHTWKYHSALKMFEYMASGTPILASNIGATTEVLNDQNAYLFNPEDMDQLVVLLSGILHNIEAAHAKARRAQEDVQNYTWQRRAAQILYFLQNK